MERLAKGRVLAALTISLALMSAALRADEVDDLIESLKPSPVDHAVWAENLLKAAERLAARPEARVRVHERAYEYGLKQAKGHPAAIKAAEALLADRPAEKLAWQQKLLDARRLHWRAADRKRKKEAGTAYFAQLMATAGDFAASDKPSEAVSLYTEASRLVRYHAPSRSGEIARKLKAVRERQKLLQQVDQCRRLLAANPGNAAMRERLIRLHVAELDDPAEAGKLLAEDVPDELRTRVGMAAKKVEDLSDEDCLGLGDWYVSLTAGATLMGRARALTRAKACYERLAGLEGDPIKAAAGKTKLANVNEQLKGLPAGLNPSVLPKDAAAFGGHYYKLFKGRCTWHKAKASCQEMGGYLACVSDAGENAFLAALCKGVDGAWLGATDEKNEGRWQWVNGEPFEYANWRQGEPSNASGKEHYLHIRSPSSWKKAGHGQWNDLRVTDEESQGFLCEWE